MSGLLGRVVRACTGARRICVMLPVQITGRLTVSDTEKFFRLLLAAEAGDADADVPALRQLVADSDAVCELLEREGDPLVRRFDRVVARWKAAA
jgi:hypothetical protein